MSYGKNKCNLLKELRQKVAQAFNLPYVPEQCEHEGNCIGTCPKCDEELAQIQEMLSKMGVKDFTLDWDAMTQWNELKRNTEAGEAEIEDVVTDRLIGCISDDIEDPDEDYNEEDEDYDPDELPGCRTTTIRSIDELFRDSEK